MTEPTATSRPDAGSTGSKLRQAAPWTVLSRLLTLVATLTFSSLAFRHLGESDFGLLSVGRTSVLLLALLGSAGLDRTMWRFAPEVRASLGEAGVRALMRRVARWQLTAGVAVAAAFSATWQPLLDWLGADAARLADSGPALAAGLLALAGATIAFQTLTQAKVSSYQTVQVTGATVVRGAVWVLGGVGAAAWSLELVGWIGAEALALAVGALVLAAVGPRAEPSPSHVLSSILTTRRQLGLAAVFGLSGLVNFVVQRQSEVFFLARYHGFGVSGLYDLAYSYPQLALEFVPLATSAVVSSAFAEIYTRDPAELRAATARYYRLLLALSLPVAAVGAVWADVLLVALFGDRAAPAAHWAQVFSLLHVLPLVFLPISAALTTVEKAHLVLPLGPIQAALAIALDVLLIPRHGIAGAAMAVSGTLAFGIPATFWLTRRVMGPVGFPARFAGRMAAASAAALIAWPLKVWLTPVWSLALGLPLSAGAIALAVWGLRVLGPEERRLLARAFERLRPRRGAA